MEATIEQATSSVASTCAVTLLATIVAAWSVVAMMKAFPTPARRMSSETHVARRHVPAEERVAIAAKRLEHEDMNAVCLLRRFTSDAAEVAGEEPMVTELTWHEFWDQRFSTMVRHVAGRYDGKRQFGIRFDSAVAASLIGSPRWRKSFEDHDGHPSRFVEAWIQRVFVALMQTVSEHINSPLTTREPGVSLGGSLVHCTGLVVNTFGPCEHDSHAVLLVGPDNVLAMLEATLETMRFTAPQYHEFRAALLALVRATFEYYRADDADSAKAMLVVDAEAAKLAEYGEAVVGACIDGRVQIPTWP